MSESSREASFLSSVLGAIGRWLQQARRLVFMAGFLYPDPSGVTASQGDWIREVRALLPELEQTAAEAWQQQSGREYVSNNSFVRAQLALTENLLVRIPDEIYQRVFAEIADGVTNNESREQIAARVDQVLTITGSEWWPNRARVIAQTETHRAWQAGILASALHYEPATGPGWVKEWSTEMDGRERPSHRRADGQVRPLNMPFNVGGALLKYPGDAAGPADEVINCRCDMIIRER
jgi:uncharacterized protein with gpF-like domain